MTNIPKTKRFDAELVITADRALDSNSSRLPILTTLITADGKEKAQFGVLLLEFLALMEEIQRTQEAIKVLSKLVKFPYFKKLLKENTALFYHQRARANELLNYFIREKLMRRQMLEVLVEGRVKIGIWLDSLGGDNWLENKLVYAEKFLKRQGAFVHSYILFKAVSAAFNLAFLGDEIHALNKSVLMWHLPDSLEFTRAEGVKLFKQEEYLPEDLNDELEAFLALLRRANSDSKEEIMENCLRQFFNPKNRRGDIRFKGSYAAKVGLINQAHGNIESLIKKFKSDFSLHANTNLVHFTTEIARKAYQVTSDVPDWIDSRAWTATDRSLEKYEKPRKKPLK